TRRSFYSLHTSTFRRPPLAPAAICTLSLHDALPILDVHVFRDGYYPCALHGPCHLPVGFHALPWYEGVFTGMFMHASWEHILGKDRKSTRLNSSHGSISYAVFCLKKKKMH